MSSACDQNEQTICSNCTDGTDQNDHTYTRYYTETTSDTNKNSDKSQVTYQQSQSTKKEDKSESIPYKEIINSDLKEEYRSLTKKLEEYLVWSMPFLYYDDADDAIISRDPSREQEILQTAKHLLDQIK